MAELLCVKDLTKVYGKRGAVTRALDGVDLSLEAGEYVGIMGASGSGKTTLLNCISTIDRPTSGSIQVDGEELTGLRGRALTRFRRERLGFIFQDCNLLDTLTAFENIALSLSILRTPAAQIRDRVEETAELLGIGDCLDKYPYQMSGGQQQRVAVARALVMNPEVLLLDEPLSNLDAKLRESVRVELRDIQKKMGLSTIYVTHDQSEALSMSDMIVVLKGGVVHQTGSPQEIYFEPKTPFVADFIGTTNLLSVKGLGENTVSYGNDRIPTTKSVNAGQEYCLSIRPECLKLVKEAVDGQVNVKVTIQNKMFLGEKIRYFVNDSLGKEWIIDIYDPGRTILEGEAYAAFPFEKAWLIEDLTD